jgi:hypothetical protein
MEWLAPAQAVVLLLLGAAATYFTQRRIEELKAEKSALAAAEARLRDERRKVYLAVLDPYTEVFHALGRGLPASEANQRLTSLDHRRAAFEFKLLATDEVVHEFNAFARFLIKVRGGGAEQPGELLLHWARLLHSIRRSVGDPATQLTARDMILDWVEDIDTVFPYASVAPPDQPSKLSPPKQDLLTG